MNDNLPYDWIILLGATYRPLINLAYSTASASRAAHIEMEFSFK